MKILVVVPSLKQKGPVIVAENIARYSENKDIEYVFISLRKNLQQDIDRFKEHNIRIYEIGMKKILQKEHIITIEKIVNLEVPNIIHVHSFWPTIIMSAFSGKYKLITTIHNNPFKDFVYAYGKLVGYIMAYVMCRYLKRYDKIIAISQYVKEIHTKRYLDNIEVIYNGIEDKFGNGNKISNKLKNKKINLITISELNKVKNIFQALKIANLLKNDNFNFNYLIIGEGKLKTKIEKAIVKLGLNNKVKLIGAVERNKVFEYLKLSDIMIFTSLSEGFGLVILESMMMGKPAIVLDIPVMHEIIDNNKDGIIARNNKEFVNAIKTLSNSLNAKTFSNQARCKYINKFTIKDMINEYEKKYNELNKSR